MKKSYKALVSDAAVFAAGNMLTKLIQFLLLPMYTALLTTEQYGIGELVNNTAELLYPLCCLGVYEGMFRFSIDRDSDNKAVLSTGIGIALSLLPVVAAAGFFGYSFTGFDYTWQLVILCFITSFKVIFLQFSKGIGKTLCLIGGFGRTNVVLCRLPFPRRFWYGRKWLPAGADSVAGHSTFACLFWGQSLAFCQYGCIFKTTGA